MGKMLGAAVCTVLLSAGGVLTQVTPAAGAQFMLTGVVVVEGGGRAWLQEPQLTGNEVVAIRVGESIGPYRLTKILEDRVELVGPNGPFAVRLAGAQGPATAAVPTPAAPIFAPAPPLPDGRPLDPPLGPPPPPGTQGVNFESLLRGIIPGG